MNPRRQPMPNALCGFSVRRTPRACHGACDHLRPGRLRASHAVCLASRTLEPVFCARKRGADIESISTTGHILAESLVMRGNFFDTQAASFGFYAASRHCIPRLSPRNSNLNAITANKALQRTAPGCHGSCYSRSGVSTSRHLITSPGAPSASHLRSYRASPPRSLSLESFGASTRTSSQNPKEPPTNRNPK